MSLSASDEIEQGAKGWHAGSSMAMLTSLVATAVAKLIFIFIDQGALHRECQTADHAQSRPGGHARIDWIEIEPIAITLSKENNLFKGQINASDAVGGAIEIDFTGNDTGTNLNFLDAV